MHSVHDLLEVAMERTASDLILKTGASPALRVDGRLCNFDFLTLTGDMMREFAREIMFSAGRDHLLQCADGIGSVADPDAVENKLRELRRMQEVNLAFTVPGKARVRAHLFMERCAIGAVLRLIPLQAPSIDELGLPALLRSVPQCTRGLVVVAGPMGMGKTTTLAALTEAINCHRHANIVMIEEPIEYLFQDRKCVIHQREVGLDTWSASTAFSSLVRQSPDVVVIGDLSDPRAAGAALNLAAEGCLVLGALQCSSIASTLDRILDGIAPVNKLQHCHLLADALLWITAQVLVPRKTGPGRVPAVEFLPTSPALQARLREGQTGEILTGARDGKYPGMTTLNQSLLRLCRTDASSTEAAMRCTGDPGALREMLASN